MTTIDGEKLLASFAGKVLLIVNVASKCGLTPQYEQLEDLQSSLPPRLQRAGVPQPVPRPGPGSEEEIKTFCSTTYGVTFRCLAKLTSTANIARRSIKN
ncbi:hypothetical protein J4734_12530 [Klebsiella pneumoniae]|uniref:Glutathione peroxidase n=1 Tax=Klebsiella pneumoniae TaxID=573 RepID=A0A939SQ53_KLEPN|nr:hypothetical protein [Klebsiella pneumoniae]